MVAAAFQLGSCPWGGGEGGGCTDQDALSQEGRSAVGMAQNGCAGGEQEGQGGSAEIQPGSGQQSGLSTAAVQPGGMNTAQPAGISTATVHPVRVSSLQPGGGSTAAQQPAGVAAVHPVGVQGAAVTGNAGTSAPSPADKPPAGRGREKVVKVAQAAPPAPASHSSAPAPDSPAPPPHSPAPVPHSPAPVKHVAGPTGPEQPGTSSGSLEATTAQGVKPMGTAVHQLEGPAIIALLNEVRCVRGSFCLSCTLFPFASKFSIQGRQMYVPCRAACKTVLHGLLQML